MPLFWNWDPVSRNQGIFCLLALLFSPWPLLTILVIVILGFPASEWEEERIALTFEEYLEIFFKSYNFSDDTIVKILTENEKFLMKDIGWSERLTKEDFERIKKTKTQFYGPLEITSHYYDMDKEYIDFFQEHATIEMDWIVEMIEMCREEWEELCQLDIDKDEYDLFFDSLEYWQDRLLPKDFNFAQKDFNYFTKAHRRKLLFEKKKKNLFSKWFLQAHLDSWLYAIPFQDRLAYTILEDASLKKYLAQ